MGEERNKHWDQVKRVLALAVQVVEMIVRKNTKAVKSCDSQTPTKGQSDGEWDN
jgi:hypothetical protein